MLKACFNRIGEFSGTTDFLLQIAEKQGKVKKGGVLDLQKAARTVLEGPIQFHFNSILIQFQFNFNSILNEIRFNRHICDQEQQRVEALFKAKKAAQREEINQVRRFLTENEPNSTESRRV